MRLSRPLGLLAAAGLAFAAIVAPAGTAGAADDFTVTTLHFAVKVGANGNDQVRHRRRPLRADLRIAHRPASRPS